MDLLPASNKREMPKAEAVPLIGLVGYQEGAVVSRTLLGEHSAPFDAMAHVLDGEANIMVAGKWLAAKAGDADRSKTIQPITRDHQITRFALLSQLLKEPNDAFNPR
jgi:hypothetical protein